MAVVVVVMVVIVVLVVVVPGDTVVAMRYDIRYTTEPAQRSMQ